MLETIVTLGAEVAAVVEFLHMGLARFSIFTRQTETAQSLILQVLALLAGTGAAFIQNVAVFPVETAPFVGFIITGIIASLPAQGIHVTLALLGIRAGSTAAVESKPSQAQMDMNATFRYAPWL